MHKDMHTFVQAWAVRTSAAQCMYFGVVPVFTALWICKSAHTQVILHVHDLNFPCTCWTWKIGSRVTVVLKQDFQPACSWCHKTWQCRQGPSPTREKTISRYFFFWLGVLVLLLLVLIDCQLTHLLFMIILLCVSQQDKDKVCPHMKLLWNSSPTLNSPPTLLQGNFQLWRICKTDLNGSRKSIWKLRPAAEHHLALETTTRQYIHPCTLVHVLVETALGPKLGSHCFRSCT